MAEEQWAAVEIMGHRQHVGRISEVSCAGAMLLRIEALRRDGTFETIDYGGPAVFSRRFITEEQARRAVLPRSWQACDKFMASVVLPALCEDCGFDVPAHEAKAKRLLPERAESPTGEDEEGPDSVPWDASATEGGANA